MGQGRRTSGPQMVDKMNGDFGAKKRLHIMLQTITEELTIPQACALLEMSEAHFHRLRNRALQAAIDSLAPQPLGRPTIVSDPLQQRIAQLQEDKRALELQLRAAQVREELIQVMPHLLRPRSEAQKKNAAASETETATVTADAAVAQRQAQRARRLLRTQTKLAGTARCAARCRRQRPRRQAEHDARWHAVALVRWGRKRGYQCRQLAALLGLAPTTLRHWRRAQRTGGLQSRRRGRTGQPLDRVTRRKILDVLEEHGLRLGVPTLRPMFPEVSRRALEDLVRRYRRMQRRRQRRQLHVLKWKVPGAVWAADFSDPVNPIDDQYPRLLAVRDLATGFQLLCLPVVDCTAVTFCNTLRALIAEHGAPLVMKSDNGSAFIAAEGQRLLDEHQIIHLPSPPGTPEYNGSVEAGIGSMKARAFDHACRHGRPEHWTCDDVEHARLQANLTAHPNGDNTPTPQQAWQTRNPLPLANRDAFRKAFDYFHVEVQRSLGYDDPEGMDSSDHALVHRKAISRALVALGYLEFRRRPYALPILEQKATKIT